MKGLENHVGSAWFQLLKLKHNELLQFCFNFAFDLNLRRYVKVAYVNLALMKDDDFIPECGAGDMRDDDDDAKVGRCRLTRE